jgi:hypothetical protein
MSWSSVQQSRLQVEKGVLSKYFRDTSWINPTNPEKTRVECRVHTNSNNYYTLRVYVPSDFPNSRPNLVVTSPYPLEGYAGKSLLRSSRSMHTLGAIDGYVQICHYRNWKPNLNLYLVVLKGRIWLEAFEAHKKTGKPMDSFL